ncbi:MAG: hypothetical protein LBQ54_03850 [Planctomycetaceae bacterium]|nr:hypothetical protein [Planctomycetaceae bacterium]
MISFIDCETRFQNFLPDRVRTLHPGRLTLTSFGSLPVEHLFQPLALCGETARFPSAVQRVTLLVGIGKIVIFAGRLSIKERRDHEQVTQSVFRRFSSLA